MPRGLHPSPTLQKKKHPQNSLTLTPQLTGEQPKQHQYHWSGWKPNHWQAAKRFFNIFSHPGFSKPHDWQMLNLPSKQLVGKEFFRVQSPGFIWKHTQFLPNYHTTALSYLSSKRNSNIKLPRYSLLFQKGINIKERKGTKAGFQLNECKFMKSHMAKFNV